MTTTDKKTSQEMHSSYLSGYHLSHPEPGEDIVISGLAGTYPDSENVYEFRDNLFNKAYLSGGAHRRWKLNNPEIPAHGGRIKNIQKFDIGFFGIHTQQAHAMDPMIRILFEKTFEAVIDAGIHPDELKGTNTGVFVGVCFSEAEKFWMYESPGKFSMTGCVRSMIPNRISQWLGVNGPSYVVDTACSSSMYAIEHAYRAIRTGQCDTAIVGGCNLCLHPYVTLQFWRLGVLNADGKCKCFDETADGYTRSEAIVAIVLQKSKDARRVYAQFLHAKTNCDGYKEQGITYPSGHIQTNLLKEFYVECAVDPSTIEYVEAHGTGTRVGDPEEVAGIDSVFCRNRTKPLLIGSVKSNIGHAEPASGLCSITKAILSMESGYLIPNINFKTARKDMEGICKGRIQIVTDKIKWDGGYLSVSSFGFGGANCHILLKSNPKTKINNGLPRDDIPRLIYISGRVAEAVNNIINDIENRLLDAEYVRLLHEVFKYDIPGHIYRGYAILSKESLLARETQMWSYKKRDLWFIFSGLSSQWPGMGKHLMSIPMFAATIERCHQVLLEMGVNLTEIITCQNANIFDNMTNTLVGITAMQIGLADLLTAIDLKPVGSIGHSIGEIACAYFNKCLTLEQALLCSYYLGQCIDQLKNATGLMLSVDVAYDQIKSFLSPEVCVACYNSEHNCVLSGNYNKMKRLSMELNEHNIYVKELETNNTALHSSYIQDIAPTVFKKFKDVIPEPKLRPEKWLSTSVLNKTTQFSKYCSADYLTNMICSTVFFEEVYNNISSDVVTLEVSPRGILQNSLKNAINDESVVIELLKEGTNNIENFLTAVGLLYINGYNPRIENIYPKINYPVSKGTPMLSPLIKWDHIEDWHVSSYDMHENLKIGERVITIKLQYDEFEYLAGHVIDARILYPATGYLALVWETASLIEGQNLIDTSIVFEDVKFHRATNIPKDGWLFLTVRILKVSGKFEVVEGVTPVVTGKVFTPNNIEKEMCRLPIPITEKKDFFLPLNSRDIYKELRLRGYNYRGLFRGLHSCDTTGETAEIKWQDNYVTFIDNMLQTQILNTDTRGLFVPTGIERLFVDTDKHKKIIENLSEDKTIHAYGYKNIKTVICGGVEIRNLDASAISKRKPLGEPVLETYKFLPNKIENVLSLAQSVRAITHVVIEHLKTFKVKTVEVLDNSDNSTILSQIVQEALCDLPLIQADVNIFTEKTIEVNGITVADKDLAAENNCALVIVSNILREPETLEAAFVASSEGAFVVSRENLDVDVSALRSDVIEIIQDYTLKTERLLLLRKAWKNTVQNYVDVSNTIKNNFEWVPVLQEAMKNDPNTIIYAQGDYYNGILGLVNCIRKEPGVGDLRCVFIMDANAPQFDPNNEFYSKQLRKGLVVNILKNGVWGTYRHILLDEIKTVKVEHAYVNVTTRGDLSSLRWLAGSLCRYTNINDKLVDIYYGALNFRDIMTASGRIAPEYIAKGRFEQECVQGLEYSGRLSDGRRVMGIVHSGATATMVSSDEVLVWDVPDEWTLQEAATVPCVYATVIFAFTVCKFKPGMTVLIHAGAGGIGQAAINIARLQYNCTVFTTVGTPEKRKFIKKNWPEITDEYIGNSRDISFVQMIMKQTNGRGVDVVINSLAEEKLLASVRCLAEGGHFLEIGKFDMSMNNPLPLTSFRKKCSFHGIMLDSFFTYTNVKKQLVHDIVSATIKNGFVKPLKSTVFERDQIEEAFRFMATGKHMGKVLIRIREEETNRDAKPMPIKVDALPRFLSSQTASYIITGGLGGFGLELTDWLILRGAKKIVLNSRRGIVTGYQAVRMKTWKSYGIDIVISTEDSTTYNGCRNMIEKAIKLGPVDGIFNLSVVLRDALFENQTQENFAICFAPKAVATKYLDEISRELCPQLRQFVIFSSVSCGRGNAGQSNYGMANSVMERICEKRKEAGLPAVAIEWGAVGDVGLVAELQEEHTELVIGGTLQQQISSCLSTLENFLNQNDPIVASMVVAEKKAGAGDSDNIIDAVANILGIKNLKTISINATLAEVGMDSIMAVEIKQTLERDFEVFLTPQDIRSMTFARLQAIASEQTADTVPAKENEENDRKPQLGAFAMVKSIGDEKNADKPYIILPSQAASDCNNRVILIPGIEGMASALEILALKLKAIPVCLQLNFHYKSDTISGLAASILQNALDNLNKSDDSFTIVGYSFGAAVTLELVSLLEARGKVGRIILIDGSPDSLKAMARHNFDTMSEEMLQNNIIVMIIRLFITEEQVKNLRIIYEKLSTWEEKLNCILEHRPKDMVQSRNHLKSFCESFYNRIKAILKYEPEISKLKSTIKLIKPKQSLVASDTEDLGLSKFTTNPVEVVYAEGNHVTVIENSECAEEINKIFTDKTIFKDSLTDKQTYVKYEAIRN